MKKMKNILGKKGMRRIKQEVIERHRPIKFKKGDVQKNMKHGIITSLIILIIYFTNSLAEDKIVSTQ